MLISKASPNVNTAQQFRSTASWRTHLTPRFWPTPWLCSVRRNQSGLRKPNLVTRSAVRPVGSFSGWQILRCPLQFTTAWLWPRPSSALQHSHSRFPLAAVVFVQTVAAAACAANSHLYLTFPAVGKILSCFANLWARDFATKFDKFSRNSTLSSD